GVRLDLDSLQEKLVRGGRGGYCFEQNLLLAAALRSAGFALTPLGARVLYRTTRMLPRTHMLLLVEADGARYIPDGGWGLRGLMLPLPFASGRELRQSHWTHRAVERDGVWRVQSLHGDAWQDLYEFSLEHWELADYEMASHYTSTHPQSR